METYQISIFAVVSARLIDILPVLKLTILTERTELKRSGLAKILVFLTTIPQETESNRAICKKLIEKWSRPVYELSSEYKYIHRSGQVYDAYDSDNNELSMRRTKRPSRILEPVDDMSVSAHSGPDMVKRDIGIMRRYQIALSLNMLKGQGLRWTQVR